MADETVLFRARVSARRLKRAQKVLEKLGLRPGDALNMMLAQIEIQQALPFEVTTNPKPVLSAEEQAEQWTEALGAY
jgi:addiction module RelB/DinJ family antitoxin